MTIAEVLLLAILASLAFWRRDLFLWVIASAGAGLLGVIWWETNIAYGLPTVMLSVVMLFKACRQIFEGDIHI